MTTQKTKKQLHRKVLESMFLPAGEGLFSSDGRFLFIVLGSMS